MIPLPSKQTVYVAVGCAAAIGVLLFPASLITLGAGAVLGLVLHGLSRAGV